MLSKLGESFKPREGLTWKQLYHLSRYSYQETFLEATLQQMGANQTRFAERLSSNKNYVKTQSMILPITMFLYTIFLLIIIIFLPFLNIRSEVNAGLVSPWAIFAGSLSIGMFFLISLVYLLLFGLLQISVLTSGESFKLLVTFPISEKDLQTTVTFTFFRCVQSQILTSLVAFPIALAILTANVTVVLVGTGVAVISLLFDFSVLILVGERIHRVLQNNDVNTLKASIIRVSTLLGVGLGGFLIAIIGVSSIQGVNALFAAPALPPQAMDLLNIIASLIPFPFAGNYFLPEIFVGSSAVPPALWGSSVVGFSFFVLLTFFLFRKARTTLCGVIYSEPKTVSPAAPGQQKPVAVAVVAPVRAFIKKDLSAATRDYQTLMTLIVPLIFPVFSIMIIAGSAGSSIASSSSSLGLFAVSGFYQLFGAVILTFGLMNTETSGASVLASLPIVVRDQALAKLVIMFIITLVAAVVPFIAVFTTPNPFPELGFFVLSLPLGPIFGLSAMELKVRLFGKLKYQYVLQDFNLEQKIPKWILILAVEFGILIVFFITVVGPGSWGASLLSTNPAELVILCLLGEVAAIVLLAVIFNHIFPRAGTIRKETKERQTHDDTGIFYI